MPVFSQYQRLPSITPSPPRFMSSLVPQYKRQFVDLRSTIGDSHYESPVFTKKFFVDVNNVMSSITSLIDQMRAMNERNRYLNSIVWYGVCSTCQFKMHTTVERDDHYRDNMECIADYIHDV